MIYLSTTQSNLATVTLYENSVNKLNPYFTWCIVKAGSNKETIFYQDDSSPAPYYYNSFTLSIGTQSGLTAGCLKYGTDIEVGQYSYKVYEMVNRYDLDISNAVGLVETGMLIVEGEKEVRTGYSDGKVIRTGYKNY